MFYIATEPHVCLKFFQLMSPEDKLGSEVSNEKVLVGKSETTSIQMKKKIAILC
jgi:hypothetical protein